MKVGQCVYCGTLGTLTEDHIPPQALWATPKPVDLIVVPSCEKCNGSASKDDEYFKTVLVMKDRAGSHPEAEAIRSSVFRGLSMPKKSKFKRKILRSLRQVSLRTPAGLDIGKALGYEVDMKRVTCVVERITRGLYWHHYAHVRLPDECLITVWPEDSLRKIPIESLQQLRSTIVDPILNNPGFSIGRDVLRYYFASGDAAHVSGWLYEFYGDVRFLAFTGKIGTQNRESP